MSTTFVVLAPIRICDLGGWSDTWFTKHGAVLNIAVSPYSECRMEVAEVPAEEVNARAFWNTAGEYVLEVTGRIVLSRVFGENLATSRMVMTCLGWPEWDRFLPPTVNFAEQVLSTSTTKGGNKD